MVRTFERVVLQKNLGKTKAMMSIPGLICGQHGTSAYKRRATGEGANFMEWKRTRLSCAECGKKCLAPYPCNCMERSYEIVMP